MHIPPPAADDGRDIFSFRYTQDRPEHDIKAGDLVTLDRRNGNRVAVHRGSSLSGAELLADFTDGSATPVGPAPDAWDALRQAVAPRARLRLLPAG